ncbi:MULTISPECIES: hypothetical protein [unclassified Gordonia (in: high G+C Gram-positive bacteria)]|uniref:DUF6928 family protein n=1 Tax=unclassified Gordonia (in: high G+C Gram-positive bacteria) TaxID=2657482 RepID=UPI001F115906|nr:hypothetical protein [Gordonia sp. ABSL49_1]MCH5643178.1 hypothetical protein [Gordonia sp. ABSL49_1]
MAARAVTLWFIDTDQPVDALRAHVEQGLPNDVGHAQELATQIFGDSVLVPAIDTDLVTAAGAQDSHVYAGCYGPLAVVSCSLFATRRPSTLTRTIATIRPSAVSTLLWTNPDDSLGVFARWESGSLRRSFAADPVNIDEDEGLPFTFEGPFWGGEVPLRYAEGVPAEPMALPFHPSQFAEESNRAWLGFRFTPPVVEPDLDPRRIPVTGFVIHPSDYEPTETDLSAYRDQNGPSTPVTEEAEPAPKRGRIARYFGFGG